MGSISSTLQDPAWSKRDLRYIMVGLKGAGKSTLLRSLNLGATTMSARTETLQHGSLTITSWDSSNEEILTDESKTHYHNTDAVIFVIDSMDRAQLGHAVQLLESLVAEPVLATAAFLIYSTKTDLLCASGSSENSLTLNQTLAAVTDALSTRNAKSKLQMVSAKTGRGVEEGFQWIFEALE